MGDDQMQARRRLTSSGSTNVFSAMEDINDKLKILNYENNFCEPR